MHVAIIVTTYRRPERLRMLLGQLEREIAVYDGPVRWTVVVADSDGTDPVVADLARNHVHLQNPGEGFDANLLHAWDVVCQDGSTDAVVSISDDDLLFPDGAGLGRIERALALGTDAVVVNHREFEEPTVAGGPLTVAPRRFYHGPETRSVDALALHLAAFPPRHVGLVYRTGLLRQHRAVLDRFLGSLHLYVVPLLFACESGRVALLDVDGFLFRVGAEDGAWTDRRGVFDGLLHLGHELVPLLGDRFAHAAAQGLERSFFGERAWLRTMLVDAGVDGLPSPTACRALLGLRDPLPAGG